MSEAIENEINFDQQAINIVSKHLPTDPRRGLERSIVQALSDATRLRNSYIKKLENYLNSLELQVKELSVQVKVCGLCNEPNRNFQIEIKRLEKELEERRKISHEDFQKINELQNKNTILQGMAEANSRPFGNKPIGLSIPDAKNGYCSCKEVLDPKPNTVIPLKSSIPPVHTCGKEIKLSNGGQIMEPKELSQFICSECGTKCRVVKKDKDVWIEPVKDQED